MANGKPIHSHWVSVKKVSGDTSGQKLIYYDSLQQKTPETGGLPITKKDHDKCTYYGRNIFDTPPTDTKFEFVNHHTYLPVKETNAYQTVSDVFQPLLALNT